MKKAVILFNLGGPDKLENVEPFLFNLFNDPAILNLPSFFRYPLAKLIANRRAPTAKKIYEELGGSSPILKLTREQANALELKLNKDDNLSEYKCFIVMRCWHPRAEKVVKEVMEYNPKEVILMPLYPQYSAATSGSSIKEWTDICIKNNFKVKTSTICCYPTDANFIEAHTVEIKKK
jgi:ferrochelatase